MSRFVAIGLAVPEKKILKGFTIYGYGGHLGYVTWFIYKYIISPVLQRLPINLSLIGRAVLEKMYFKYYGNLHVYCPGVGADPHLGPKFFSES